MPTYQFRCANCEHAFEVIQSFDDDSVPNCPECQGEAKKVYGGIGVLFKGPGFYKTDSRPKPTSSGSSD
jgi:putative FmdB family regulatory protein